MWCHVLDKKGPGMLSVWCSIVGKEGQLEQKIIIYKGLIACLVMSFAWQDGTRECLVSKLTFTRQGSRRDEASSWNVGCLSWCFTCLTRRSPGIFSVGQQFRQARAADWKDPRLEALIAFLVMSRAWLKGAWSSFSVLRHVDKEGQPARRRLVEKCWLLVKFFNVLDKKGPGYV